MLVNKQKLYNWCFIIIFATSIILQTYLFLQNPSFWEDEASLAISVVGRSVFGLTSALENYQTAPLGFLIISKLMLKVFNPQTTYFQDLCLRFIPYIFAIISIPLFYFLARKVIKNQTSLFVANCFFALSPNLIGYSTQFKQYTLECCISILLFLIFYNILVKNQKNIFTYLVLFFAFWFSLSSIFIIVPALILILFYKRNYFKSLFITFSFSSVILYCVNLKNVYSQNYGYMENFWNNCYAFVSPLHPMRLLMRFSTIIFPNTMKPINIIIGALLLFIIILYLTSQKIRMPEKLLFTLPLVAVTIASTFHKYPVQARLILFLLPSFVIILSADVRNYCSKIFLFAKTILLLTSLYSLIYYQINPSYVSYSYARDLISYYEHKFTKDDLLIIDKLGFEYKYYLLNKKIENKIITLPYSCFYMPKECKANIENLPKGNYYFFTTGYGTDKLLKDEKFYIKTLCPGYTPKKIKAVYISK